MKKIIILVLVLALSTPWLWSCAPTTQRTYEGAGAGGALGAAAV